MVVTDLANVAIETIVNAKFFDETRQVVIRFHDWLLCGAGWGITKAAF
jgi:hypothetical protein